ncbi:MAG: twin-arginine translocation signal domain-containing protein, partial [Mesorhizobium sp.]
MTNESLFSTATRAGISRRYFLQVTAAGVVTATALGASGLKA